MAYNVFSGKLNPTQSINQSRCTSMPDVYIKGHFIQMLSFGQTERQTADQVLYLDH